MSAEQYESPCDKYAENSSIRGNFHNLFQKSRDFLVQHIQGTSNEKLKQEFVNHLIIQILILWYLQQRGLLNNNPHYLINKFHECKQKKFSEDFKSYYHFLVYFLEKIEKSSSQNYFHDALLGTIYATNPMLVVDNNIINLRISIPDECFYQEGFTEFLVNIKSKKTTPTIPLLNLLESFQLVNGEIDSFLIGTIYEKLLSGLERKQTGTFYTPKIIAKFISENTINPLLVGRINNKFNQQFQSITQILETKNENIILDLFNQLQEITILDPSVGSGHFLISAIDVLVEIYEKVWKRAKELGVKKGMECTIINESGKLTKRNFFEIEDNEQFKFLVKFFIILPRSIYGVDINPLSIKLATIRIFLNLTKHFQTDKAYNVRFSNVKINLRTGDALVGFNNLSGTNNKIHASSTIQESASSVGKTNITSKTKIYISADLQEYLESVSQLLKLDLDIVFACEKLNAMVDKDRLEDADVAFILRTKAQLVEILNLSLQNSYAQDVAKLITKLTELFRSKFDELFCDKHDIDLQKLKHMPSFHWPLEFPEMFLNNNGFDVVLGNPPYILEVRGHKELFHIYRTIPIGEFYEQKMDLFYFFIIQAIKLLRPKGMLGFLVQEYWISRKHAKKLRKYVFSQTTPMIFVFFKDFKIFKDARGQHNMLLILQKEVPKQGATVKVLTLDKPSINESEQIFDLNLVSNNLFSVRYCDVASIYKPTKDIVFLSDNRCREIMRFIESRSFYLDKKEVQQGIVTPQHHLTKKSLAKLSNPSNYSVGEGIFVLSKEEHDRIDFNAYERSLLKPFHFAEELDSYSCRLEEQHFLIYTTNEIIHEIAKHPKRYPNITRHLARFQEVITSDHKPYGLHRPRQPEWFEDSKKIIGVRKTQYPKFAVVPVPYYIDQAAIIIRPTKHQTYSPYFLCAVLNSNLAYWYFYNLKTQGHQLQIDKSIALSFPIIKATPEQQEPVIILSQILHFIKTYSQIKVSEDLKSVAEFFNILLNTVIYELYFLPKLCEDKIYPASGTLLIEEVSTNLEHIEYEQWLGQYNKKLLEDNKNPEEIRRKQLVAKNMQIIERNYQALSNNQLIKNLIVKVRSHPWIRAIEISTYRNSHKL